MTATPSRRPTRAAVVAGVDPSETSAIALRWAARLAEDRGRTLLVVHAADPKTARRIAGDDAATEPFLAAIRTRGARLLTQAEALAHEIAPAVTVVTELLDDNPARSLIARSADAYMVVLGATPDLGRLDHVGSTLLAVTAHARGAVVVVRGLPAGDRAPVVVGVDGSRVGEPAIATAFAEAAERGVDLVAVHAWSDLSVPEFAGASYVGAPAGTLAVGECALLSERLAGWGPTYPNVSVIPDVTLSGPRERLGEWSRKAQLVVVGSRGRGGFRALLLGSTSSWLVQHSDCPVMVVHPD